ncbi:hypothetical protein, partial [Arthrobacter rhombi]|uniref:hypothetical protein n=2 Tax=Arthrobacter rhombi TaxID=71253 RepID=UPI003F9053E9
VWGRTCRNSGTAASALLSVLAVGMAIACQQLLGLDLAWLAARSIAWCFLVSIAAGAGAEALPCSVPAEELGTLGSAQRTIILGVMPVAALLGGTAAVPIIRSRSRETYLQPNPRNNES